MLILILNKIFLIAFFMAIFNTTRHGFFAFLAWTKRNDEDIERYILTPKSLILLGLSIAFIITSIITGIYI